jgi:hypothetical protein
VNPRAPSDAASGGGNATEAGPIFTLPASGLDKGQLAVGVMFK